ncbi:hypothetical protein AGLY_011391, partial [Aphis glycines]
HRGITYNFMKLFSKTNEKCNSKTNNISTFFISISFINKKCTFLCMNFNYRQHNIHLKNIISSAAIDVVVRVVPDSSFNSPYINLPLMCTRCPFCRSEYNNTVPVTNENTTTGCSSLPRFCGSAPTRPKSADIRRTGQKSKFLDTHQFLSLNQRCMFYHILLSYRFDFVFFSTTTNIRHSVKLFNNFNLINLELRFTELCKSCSCVIVCFNISA